MISIYINDFFKMALIQQLSASQVPQKYRRVLNFSTFISGHSQIWLNIPVKDRQFGYITKLGN
jgi:hypothetical protein